MEGPCGRSAEYSETGTWPVCRSIPEDQEQGDEAGWKVAYPVQAQPGAWRLKAGEEEDQMCILRKSLGCIGEKQGWWTVAREGSSYGR